MDLSQLVRVLNIVTDGRVIEAHEQITEGDCEVVRVPIRFLNPSERKTGGELCQFVRDWLRDHAPDKRCVVLMQRLPRWTTWGPEETPVTAALTIKFSSAAGS